VPPGAAAGPAQPSATRGPTVAIATAQGIALAGAAAIVGLGNVLDVDVGLVALAALLGWLIAASLAGTRPTLVPRARQALAVLIASEAVLAGQLGLWLLARAQGGVLDPLTYLGEVFGIVVPLQFGVAIAAAWWTSR